MTQKRNTFITKEIGLFHRSHRKKNENRNEFYRLAKQFVTLKKKRQTIQFKINAKLTIVLIFLSIEQLISSKLVLCNVFDLNLDRDFYKPFARNEYTILKSKILLILYANCWKKKKK